MAQKESIPVPIKTLKWIAGIIAVLYTLVVLVLCVYLFPWQGFMYLTIKDYALLLSLIGILAGHVLLIKHEIKASYVIAASTILFCIIGSISNGSLFLWPCFGLIPVGILFFCRLAGRN